MKRRRTKLLSRPYFPSPHKLKRDISLFRGIRSQLREQQKNPPVEQPNQNQEQ